MVQEYSSVLRKYKIINKERMKKTIMRSKGRRTVAKKHKIMSFYVLYKII